MVGEGGVQDVLRDGVERHAGARLAIAHVDLHEPEQVRGRLLVRLVPLRAHHRRADRRRRPRQQVAHRRLRRHIHVAFGLSLHTLK